MIFFILCVWFQNIHRNVCIEMCLGWHGLPLMFAIFCLVGVVNVVLHVRWVFLACLLLLSRVTFDVNFEVLNCGCGHVKS